MREGTYLWFGRDRCRCHGDHRCSTLPQRASSHVCKVVLAGGVCFVHDEKRVFAAVDRFWGLGLEACVRYSLTGICFKT
jgi:hypothetical protein